MCHFKDMQLDPIQIRVLGSLMEKEITTPEGYPLSLNALVNACNQRSSRDPVLDLGEEEVRQGLHALEELGLVTAVHDARVPKYEHRARTVLNLRRDETAAICLLLLRGPQTPGEIRSRADRLYSFDDLAAAQATLERLAARPLLEDSAAPAQPSTGPLVVLLPRQPGSREARYAHLLGGAPDVAASTAHERTMSAPEGSVGRLAELETETAVLRDRVSVLEGRVQALETKIIQLEQK